MNGLFVPEIIRYADMRYAICPPDWWRESDTRYETTDLVVSTLQASLNFRGESRRGERMRGMERIGGKKGISTPGSDLFLGPCLKMKED